MIFFEFNACKGIDTGYVFPRNPGLTAIGFSDRLQKIEGALRKDKVSYAAKRAALASKKRKQDDCGNSKFVKS